MTPEVIGAFAAGIVMILAAIGTLVKTISTIVALGKKVDETKNEVLSAQASVEEVRVVAQGAKNVAQGAKTIALETKEVALETKEVARVDAKEKGEKLHEIGLMVDGRLTQALEKIADLAAQVAVLTKHPTDIAIAGKAATDAHGKAVTDASVALAHKRQDAAERTPITPKDLENGH